MNKWHPLHPLLKFLAQSALNAISINSYARLTYSIRIQSLPYCIPCQGLSAYHLRSCIVKMILPLPGPDRQRKILAKSSIQGAPVTGPPATGPVATGLTMSTSRGFFWSCYEWMRVGSSKMWTGQGDNFPLFEIYFSVRFGDQKEQHDFSPLLESSLATSRNPPSRL
ncbi:hypothetical protein L873DRAFT_1466669 [Choiromyces venosus 120613-1]|uniref:Uncharacterized protein n=1 Tax=Choiromyces venosus 120613-1 TaxID=1336337 RepID=A0A3N4JCQ4_9PEZI|nr:hypothetical protein L873DRAFT_1466669 [Choiromyces venosus 120613-1]